MVVVFGIFRPKTKKMVYENDEEKDKEGGERNRQKSTKVKRLIVWIERHTLSRERRATKAKHMCVIGLLLSYSRAILTKS